MANSVLLVDIEVSTTYAVTATWADITSFAPAAVTVAGTGSVILLMMSLNIDDVGDECAEFRFTHDGSFVGYEQSAFADATNGTGGASMMFALTGLAAGTHTFAVQAQGRTGTTVVDAAFPRTFQVIEIKTGCSILVNKASTGAYTFSATYENITDMSDTQTAAASAIHMFINGSQLEDGSDTTANFRFAIGGTQEGPEMKEFTDAANECQGKTMSWVRSGLSAASHVFSVQGEISQAGPAYEDGARTRIFQVLEFTSLTALPTDKSSVNASECPVTYADIVDMTDSPDIDSTDSVALVMCNMTQSGGTDETSNNRFSISGSPDGAECSVFSDNNDDVSGHMMARAVTGVSGTTAMSLQWERRNNTATANTSLSRSFQVLDLQTAAGAAALIEPPLLHSFARHRAANY